MNYLKKIRNALDDVVFGYSNEALLDLIAHDLRTVCFCGYQDESSRDGKERFDEHFLDPFSEIPHGYPFVVGHVHDEIEANVIAAELVNDCEDDDQLGCFMWVFEVTEGRVREVRAYAEPSD